jgi:hypothetical protein
MHRWAVFGLLLSASASAAASPTESTAAAEPEETPGLRGSEEWEFSGPTRLDLGVRIGYAHRLDDPPFYTADERNGFVLGPEVTLFVVRRVALGLAYEHYLLGGETSGLTPVGAVDVTRTLDTLWLNARLYPILTDRAGLYLGISVGPSWQGAELAGSVWPAHDPGAWQSFHCEGSDTPGPAVRAEIGGDVALAGGLRALVAVGADGYRLSDDLIDDCVPGAGSTTVFGLRLGLVYAMDL